MHRVLYHRTTRENAELIFRDKFCTCGIQDHHRGAHGASPGVWLSNIPLLPFKRFYPPEKWTLDGQHGTAQLEVTVDATGAFMDEHEWKGEPLFREWLIEASELNARIIGIRILTIKEMAQVCEQPVLPMLEHQELVSDADTLASVF